MDGHQLASKLKTTMTIIGGRGQAQTQPLHIYSAGRNP
jgi:hypothetical protein